MDLNKTISTDTEVEDPQSLNFSTEESVTSEASCKMNKSKVSLIEEELSNSLKMIESGLNNLDIEAAHLLNPPGFKISCPPENIFSKNGIKPLMRVPKRKGATDRIDISSLSESSTELKSKYESNPPDLTFSFYSSSEEDIILSTPLEPPKSTLESPVLPLNYIIQPSCPTLEEILNCPTEANFSSEIGFKSGTSDENSRSKSSNGKNESVNLVIEMQDLVESLSKMKSALDNLDREAAHLLNPPGFKLSYINPSAETPSLQDNNIP